MRHVKIKQFVLLLGLMIPTIGGNAVEANLVDDHSKITIMQGNVQGVPKGSTILASINGHTLDAIFSLILNNLPSEKDSYDEKTRNNTTKQLNYLRNFAPKQQKN